MNEIRFLGYPDYLNFDEFQRRFAMFITPESSALNNSINTADLIKQTCINIIKSFDLDSSYYKIGTTQVSLVYL
jgi:myosin heavy subunit